MKGGPGSGSARNEKKARQAAIRSPQLEGVSGAMFTVA
jgi:hypothetical protein